MRTVAIFSRVRSEDGMGEDVKNRRLNGMCEAEGALNRIMNIINWEEPYFEEIHVLIVEMVVEMDDGGLVSSIRTRIGGKATKWNLKR